MLGIIEASGMTLKDLQSRGVKWQGLEDTKFFKITGTATNGNCEAIFDV
jgi:hypothetical protein